MEINGYLKFVALFTVILLIFSVVFAIKYNEKSGMKYEIACDELDMDVLEVTFVKDKIILTCFEHGTDKLIRLRMKP